mmetsp:Transcript_5910/g.7669  ORF Transcript_5910/g.7669 Transcript_5910/m.7669 type:complete len:125 (-) Transcript_5910:175-549(-)|eukprot:CAMPEP_0114348898 /NCGR_PEP_ID=MMETSP0101-20121206/15102_1 /TAXON_ID=38822 ORGANISM="Pteridomonas danica, Strain PT" /NCGR_SAMPLE_ID=MMETSP0101 /ASSEMBLY_ACC=CAM_ASM_000211 /LENGTH=124 /DNA_ID=CAMNT_0001487151 /DNA_START=15 /DNA_END=389 /DNA_ORIENTATION=+
MAEEAPTTTFNEEWVAAVTALESNGHLTTAEPGKWAGKEGKHVPSLAVEDGKVNIACEKHPMEEAHWVNYLWAKNQDGELIAIQAFVFTDKPVFTFDVPEGVTSITAYGACNLHDAWATDPLTL